jgi:hypothetical protein
VKFKFTVRMPTIKLAVDTTGAETLASELWEFSQALFLQGRQPDGDPLPVNLNGLPLGVGGGSLVRSWRPRTLAKRNGQTIAVVEPTDRGRLLVAIRKMAKRGVRFQGLDGVSGERWNSLAREHARIVMTDALSKARKSR